MKQTQSALYMLAVYTGVTGLFALLLTEHVYFTIFIGLCAGFLLAASVVEFFNTIKHSK